MSTGDTGGFGTEKKGWEGTTTRQKGKIPCGVGDADVHVIVNE